MARKVNYGALSAQQRADRRSILAGTLAALQAALCRKGEADVCEACGRAPQPPTPSQLVILSKQILELDGEIRELDSAEEDSGRARLVEREREIAKLKRELAQSLRKVDELEHAINTGNKP